MIRTQYFVSRFRVRNMLAILIGGLLVLVACTKSADDSAKNRDKLVGVWSLYAIRDSGNTQWNFKPLHYESDFIFVRCELNRLSRCTPTYGSDCKALGIDTFIIERELLELRNDDSFFITTYRNDKLIDFVNSTCTKYAYNRRAFIYVWPGPNTWTVNSEKNTLFLNFPGSNGSGAQGYQRLPNSSYEYNIIEVEEQKLIIYLPARKKYYYYIK